MYNVTCGTKNDFSCKAQIKKYQGPEVSIFLFVSLQCFYVYLAAIATCKTIKKMGVIIFPLPFYFLSSKQNCNISQTWSQYVYRFNNRRANALVPPIQCFFEKNDFVHALLAK